MHILVIDNDSDVNKRLCMNLESEQYTVHSYNDINSAGEFLLSYNYDALILNITLPDFDISDITESVRSHNIYIPIIVLSDSNDKDSIISILDKGADDYIAIPFDYDIFLARLRVTLRNKIVHNHTIYTCGNLILNNNDMSVTRDGSFITLTPREYAILEYMMQHQNIVLTREQLQKDIWNLKSSRSSNVVDVYIRYLRKKIDDDYDNKLIHTIRGLGYILSSHVE